MFYCKKKITGERLKKVESAPHTFFSVLWKLCHFLESQTSLICFVQVNMSVSYNSYWFLHLGRLFILRFTWQWKSFWELMVKKMSMAKFRMLGYIYVWLHWCRELGVGLWRYPAPITTPLNIPRTPFAKKRRLPGIKFCIYKKLIQSFKKNWMHWFLVSRSAGAL